MASVLEQYGVKEVADVIFYELDENENINYNKPVLFFDSLKVSTVEQTAENVSARGGIGNPELIIWDYNKEITVTLEDALFSAKSLQMMFGAKKDIQNSESLKIYRAIPKVYISHYYSSAPTTSTDLTNYVTSNNTTVNYIGYKLDDGGIAIGSIVAVIGDEGYHAVEDGISYQEVTYAKEVIVSFDASKISDSYQIDINSDEFPGYYALVGDTKVRSRTTGEDEYFQFIIYKAKMLSEVSFNFEAEGDPSTFTMTMKAVKPAGVSSMMSLTKYMF